MHKLFPSQLDNEQIYLVVREHWVNLFLKILLWLLFVVVLALFKMYTPQYMPFLQEGDAQRITSLFVTVYDIFLLVSLFMIWLLYYLNIQIITDLRIVDISQEGLFSHTVSELHIDKIEDVSSKTEGVLGTVF